MCVKIDEVSKLNIRETSMQNLNFFLNKNDALKIDLINYILENDFNSYDMRQLETEFSISDYMLTGSTRYTHWPALTSFCPLIVELAYNITQLKNFRQLNRQLV